MAFMHSQTKKNQNGQKKCNFICHFSLLRNVKNLVSFFFTTFLPSFSSFAELYAAVVAVLLVLPPDCVEDSAMVSHLLAFSLCRCWKMFFVVSFSLNKICSLIYSVFLKLTTNRLLLRPLPVFLSLLHLCSFYPSSS